MYQFLKEIQLQSLTLNTNPKNISTSKNLSVFYIMIFISTGDWLWKDLFAENLFELNLKL